MNKIVIYRGNERIQGTHEEVSNILGMRLYVFNRFLKTGKSYNNPRLKGVRVTDEKPIVGMKAIVAAMSTPGTPENDAVKKRAPRENISKKVDNKKKLFCFEKDGIYLNARQSYALCIASDHKKREYRFVAIYNTPNGYKLASASNEGAVTTTNEDGMSPNEYKVMYHIDLNAMSAEDLKEFIAIRNFARGKLGQEQEVFVAVESKIVEVVKDPGLLDRAVLEDRLKNLETVVEQLRGIAK